MIQPLAVLCVLTGFITLISSSFLAASGGGNNCRTTRNGSRSSTTCEGGSPPGVIAGLIIVVLGILLGVFFEMAWNKKCRAGQAALRTYFERDANPRWAARGFTWLAGDYREYSRSGQNRSSKTVFYVALELLPQPNPMAGMPPGAVMPPWPGAMPGQMPPGAMPYGGIPVATPVGPPQGQPGMMAYPPYPGYAGYPPAAGYGPSPGYGASQPYGYPPQGQPLAGGQGYPSPTASAGSQGNSTLAAKLGSDSYTIAGEGGSHPHATAPQPSDGNLLHGQGQGQGQAGQAVYTPASFPPYGYDAGAPGYSAGYSAGYGAPPASAAYPPQSAANAGYPPARTSGL